MVKLLSKLLINLPIQVYMLFPWISCIFTLLRLWLLGVLCSYSAEIRSILLNDSRGRDGTTIALIAFILVELGFEVAYIGEFPLG